MPKYLDVAAQANSVAKELMVCVEGLSEEKSALVAELVAKLVNLGIRCSPRGVQHTVRLNAVKRAVEGLPVKVGMIQKKDERTGRTYNVLVTETKFGKKVDDNDSSADDE